MYRVRTSITGGSGGPWLSTMYFNVIGGLTAQNAVAATGAFWNGVKNLVATGIVMATEADVATMEAGTGEITGITATTPVSVTGTGTGTTAPTASQGLIRWRTGYYVGGREIRGRTFIPGLCVAAVASGNPTASYLSTANAAAATLVADANSELMIWSKKNGEVAPVLLGSTWSSFAVLRSRRD